MIKIDVIVRHKKFNGKEWVCLEALDNPDLVSQGRTYKEAYRELISNYNALQEHLQQAKEFPFADKRSFYLWGKFVPVRQQCPKCNGANYDEGVIDPKTGICDNCGFDIRAMKGEDKKDYVSK